MKDIKVFSMLIIIWIVKMSVKKMEAIELFLTVDTSHEENKEKN